MKRSRELGHYNISACTSEYKYVGKHERRAVTLNTTRSMRPVVPYTNALRTYL
jgi:hypothetical protein